MARQARIVVPGIPHHVTQRGNRRMETFQGDADYALYKALLAEFAAKADVAVWAYCLMPNHVHLILVPSDEDGLRRALGETHRRYTRHVNTREGWQGHLWQERFHSCPMDEGYLRICTRYVELNPVRAGLTKTPEDWQWSSARAHLTAADDGLAAVQPLLERIPDWRAFLAEGLTDDARDAVRTGERTGRPLGAPAFIQRLESETGRILSPGKRGRPKKTAT